MELSISYGVAFGKLDAGDLVDCDTIELSAAESRAAMKYALMDRLDEILELPELETTYADLYSEIEAMEIENSLDMEDEYAMECQGIVPMDTDKLNDLVHRRDAHALMYFGLEDADDEEIEAWDANGLDEIPTIAEFDPCFEPRSPFDTGWTLNLCVDDASITEEELTAYLKELFSENDLDTINDIVENCAIGFDRRMEDIVLDAAKEMKCQEYIDAVSSEG